MSRAFSKPQRGFTLIELLVTIVILGFAIGVMSSAFTQVAQVLRVAAESGSGFQGRWLRTRALSDLVSNLVLSDEPDSRLDGSVDSLEGVTLASPLAAAGVPQRVHVQLAPARLPDGKDATDLRIRVVGEPPKSGDRQADVRWVQWPGQLRFGYIDRSGKEYGEWPPTPDRRDELPSEVLVRPVQEDKVLVRTAVFEGPLYKPQAANTNALRDFLGFAR